VAQEYRGQSRARAELLEGRDGFKSPTSGLRVRYSARTDQGRRERLRTTAIVSVSAVSEGRRGSKVKPENTESGTQVGRRPN